MKALVLAVVATIAATGCGGSSSGGSSGGSPGGASGGTLYVSAAASLTNAFTHLVSTYQHAHPGWTVKTTFDGSDILEAQILQHAPADVFAAASPKYPEILQGKKLLGQATSFATNTLVLVTPKSNPAHITSPQDLTQGSPKIVVADPAVPLGSYTDQVLANLGIDETKLHIVSKEQNAEDVLAKLTSGEADAGFVYVTDALSQKARLHEVEFPASAQATATYPIGIVGYSKNTKAAQQWIDLVMSAQGQAVLKQFGFGAAPSG
ncbi:MAG TPA: molybdate ABC transporter substrate-binding protein [Gaiellales bacterium]